MPLGPEILLQLVRDEALVSNLSERELTNPEGAGFDLRVGEIHRLEKGRGFVGIKDRNTVPVESVAKFNPDSEEQVTFRLMPGEYVLMTTVESVKLPKDLCAYNYARSSLFRSGVGLFATQVAPGYEGQLSFGLCNLRTVPKGEDPNDFAFEFEMGARLTHIQFEPVEGGGSAYRGQWQGGRVAATERETQV